MTQCCLERRHMHAHIFMLCMSSAFIFIHFFIIIIATDEIYYDGQVRLVGGDYTSQGNLQVFAQSEWRYVCGDNGFSLANAESVCRQLGYTNTTQPSLVQPA